MRQVSTKRMEAALFEMAEMNAELRAMLLEKHELINQLRQERNDLYAQLWKSDWGFGHTLAVVVGMMVLVLIGTALRP